MKIAVIYPSSLYASWSMSDGLSEALRRMNHEVTDLPRGQGRKPFTITKDLLNAQDLVILSGPEHVLTDPAICPFNKHELTLLEWRDEVKTPKAFWYHESLTREDKSWSFAPLNPLADHHFFPAAQDASLYDQDEFAKGRAHWLPFGVDTEVFRPAKCVKCFGKGINAPSLRLMGMLKNPAPDNAQCDACLGTGFQPTHKSIECGFIGLLYPKRVAFLNQLERHVKRGEHPFVSLGGVALIQDIEGPQWKETAERLASNYRRIGIFLNMPHLSQLMVSKVLEVMACGTFLLTPMMEGRAEANLDPFEHCKHLCYYQESNLPFLWQTLQGFHRDQKAREQIAMAGIYEVRKNHSIEVRLEQMFAAMGLLQQLESKAADAHS